MTMRQQRESMHCFSKIKSVSQKRHKQKIKAVIREVVRLKGIDNTEALTYTFFVSFFSYFFTLFNIPPKKA